MNTFILDSVCCVGRGDHWSRAPSRNHSSLGQGETHCDADRGSFGVIPAPRDGDPILFVPSTNPRLEMDKYRMRIRELRVDHIRTGGRVKFLGRSGAMSDYICDAIFAKGVQRT